MKSETQPETPLFSSRVRGKWKNQFIFEVIRGKQQVRTFTAYDASPKAHLSPFQSSFAAAVAAWQALTPSEKNFYNNCSEALRRRLPGYNVFISQWLRS